MQDYIDYILSAHIYTVEDLEFLILLYIYVHVNVMSMHEWNSIMAVLIVSAKKITFYRCKLCMKCRSHEIFSSRADEFLNHEIFAKSRDSPFGKFALSNNNPLYGIHGYFCLNCPQIILCA